MSLACHHDTCISFCCRNSSSLLDRMFSPASGLQNKTVNNNKKKTLTPKRESREQIFATTLYSTPAWGFGNKNCQQQTLTPKERPWGAKFCSQLCCLLLHFSSKGDKRRFAKMMVRRMIVPNWVMRVRLWWEWGRGWCNKGREMGYRCNCCNGGNDFGKMWMENGGRERKQGSGQKGNPKISKSSCRPVTVGWSQGFMEMGNCWWYIQSENRERTVFAWEPNIIPSAKKISLGSKFRSNTKIKIKI